MSKLLWPNHTIKKLAKLYKEREDTGLQTKLTWISLRKTKRIALAFKSNKTIRKQTLKPILLTGQKMQLKQAGQPHLTGQTFKEKRTWSTYSKSLGKCAEIKKNAVIIREKSPMHL